MARIVPLLGDSKESLLAALERHREAILWKLDGLADEQLRTSTLNGRYGLVRRTGVDASGHRSPGRGDGPPRRHMDVMRELIDGATGDHERP